MLRGYVSEYRACWDSLPSVAKWYVEDYDVAWRREELYTRGKITYQKIKAYILEKYGFKVSSLYIAQIKGKCGLGKERTGRKMIRQRSNSVHLKGK